MMTPEERALSMVHPCGKWTIEDVRLAIRAAVLEEREACAAIASAHFWDGDNAGLSIAAYIRERGAGHGVGRVTV